jgi:uncharacterized protein YcnI
VPRPTLTRSLRRTGALTAAAFTVAVVLAGPAAAHTEVEAEGARALDRNVALTFTAESESGTAGISKLEVILPEGITPGDVTYKDGPDGWKLAPTGRGYTVSGPRLGVGEDAEYIVSVRQLPDVRTLVFKTLQTYGDGRVDRWIELEEDSGGDGHGHGHPAPRLELKPAVPGAKAVSPTPTGEPTTASPSTSAPSTPSAEAAADGTDGDDGLPPALPLGVGAAVVVLGAGLWWLRSRRGGAA